MVLAAKASPRARRAVGRRCTPGHLLLDGGGLDEEGGGR
jgi:hypothetical protein